MFFYGREGAQTPPPVDEPGAAGTAGAALVHRMVAFGYLLVMWKRVGKGLA